MAVVLFLSDFLWFSTTNKHHLTISPYSSIIIPKVSDISEQAAQFHTISLSAGKLRHSDLTFMLINEYKNKYKTMAIILVYIYESLPQTLTFTSLKGETENCIKEGYALIWNITHCQAVFER